MPDMPDMPSDLSVRSIEPHPFDAAWLLSQSEVGPGQGTGGFWSLPLFVQTGGPGAAGGPDFTTGSVRDEDGSEGEWKMLLGTPGRLNGRTTIDVRYPRIYLGGGLLSANKR